MTILGSTAWISDWSASQIAGVDLAARRVTRTLHVGDWQDEPVSMTSGAGSLWVLDFSGPLLRIDPASGAITRRFPVRGLGADIAYGDGFIWVITDEPAADGGQEYLDKIDPSRGVIVKEAPVPGAGPACAVSPGPQGIWIGCAGVDRITSINQGSLQPAESLRVDSGGYTPQIVPGRNAVWVLTPSGLARADPATGQITWCRLLGLYDCDDLKNAEPGTLRYRLPSLPARLVRHARASSARAGRAPGTARCWRAFSGESNRSYNETSRPGMTASSGRAGRPLRPAAVLNGTHRLLPAAGPRPRDLEPEGRRSRTFWLGLVCRGGRVGFLESLVGDVMSLRGAAQIGQLASHKIGFGNRSQHADSRFAPGQLPADPLAIGLVESQALVVQRAQQPAAYQADGEPDGGEQRQDQTDTGALAHAALADLLDLDLALLVEDQDADGVVVRHPRVLQGSGCHVGSCLVLEDRQDHGPVRHERSLSRMPGDGRTRQRPEDRTFSLSSAILALQCR